MKTLMSICGALFLAITLAGCGGGGGSGGGGGGSGPGPTPVGPCQMIGGYNAEAKTVAAYLSCSSKNYCTKFDDTSFSAITDFTQQMLTCNSSSCVFKGTDGSIFLECMLIKDRSKNIFSKMTCSSPGNFDVDFDGKPVISPTNPYPNIGVAGCP